MMQSSSSSSSSSSNESRRKIAMHFTIEDEKAQQGQDADDYHCHNNNNHNIVSDVEEEEEGEIDAASSMTTSSRSDDASLMSSSSSWHITAQHDEHEQHEQHEQHDAATTTSTRTAQVGDIVTLDLLLIPENGFVPEPLFDTTGKISFVVGWGNYLPGLHQLVLQQGCSQVGQVIENVSLDAGWGSRRDDLIFTVPKTNLMKRHNNVVQNVEQIQAGSWLQLHQQPNNGGGGGTSTTPPVEVWVDRVTEDAVVLDANPPLAGSSYSCSFRVLSIDSLPSLDPETSLSTSRVTTGRNSERVNETSDSSSNYCVATFATGCFWGAELAFARQVGVVGTKVGYTQGITPFPTYQQVCTGTTRHREAVMVIYNPKQVSYTQLLELACQRIEETTDSSAMFSLFDKEEDDNDDENTQYKHGFYYHTEEQCQSARSFLQERQQHRFRAASSIELLQASAFYEAEESHQQYLYKGGQSARKGAKETIRCYG